MRLADPRSPGRRLRAHARRRSSASRARDRPADHRRLRHHLGRRGRGGAGRRHRGDRHRPPPAGRAAARTARSCIRSSRGYPFAGLCAPASPTSSPSRCAAPRRRDADLDLVALATVADLVPLVGENRTLVRRGIAVARRARRPGIRALMAVAPGRARARRRGRLRLPPGPRINAAGRLYRADAGVELMLTADEARASEIAAELDRANLERREVEREVLEAAERSRARAAARSSRGARAGARRRGLASRRRRHRRLADGRAHRAPGRADRARRARPRPRLRPQHPRLRPARGARACDGAPRPLRRPPRRGRGRDRGRAASTSSGAPSPRTARRRLEGEPRAGCEAVDAVVGTEALGHDVAEQLRPAGAVRQGQPGRPAARPRAQARRRAADGGGGPARPLLDHERLGSGARGRLRRQRRARRGGRGGPARLHGRARAQPLERGGRAPRRARRALPGRADGDRRGRARSCSARASSGAASMPRPRSISSRLAAVTRGRGAVRERVDRRSRARCRRRSPRSPPAARRCWSSAPTRSAAASWSSARCAGRFGGGELALVSAAPAARRRSPRPRPG